MSYSDWKPPYRAGIDPWQAESWAMSTTELWIWALILFPVALIYLFGQIAISVLYEIDRRRGLPAPTRDEEVKNNILKTEVTK